MAMVYEFKELGSRDRFVEGHPFGQVYHLSIWREAIHQTFPHMKGRCLAILDGDAIKAGIPVFEVRSRLLGNGLVSIPYATLCDPLVENREEARELLDVLNDLGRQAGVRRIEVRAFLSGHLLDDQGFGRLQQYKTHVLTLAPNPDSLKRTFDRTCVVQKINRTLKRTRSRLSPPPATGAVAAAAVRGTCSTCAGRSG